MFVLCSFRNFHYYCCCDGGYHCLALLMLLQVLPEEKWQPTEQKDSHNYAESAGGLVLGFPAFGWPNCSPWNQIQTHYITTQKEKLITIGKDMVNILLLCEWIIYAWVQEIAVQGFNNLEATHKMSAINAATLTWGQLAVWFYCYIWEGRIQFTFIFYKTSSILQKQIKLSKILDSINS